MGQPMIVLQFQQSFKIMSLISFNTESLYHMQDHFVIISSYLIAAIFLWPEITCNAMLFWIRKNHRGGIIFHPLRNCNVNLQSLLFFAGKMNESSHSMKQTFGNRKSKSKPSNKTTASRFYLIKIITHLCNLRIGHTNSSIINIYNQIDSVKFSSKINTNIKTAFFCKLDRILQNNLKNMRNFFCISEQNCRYSGCKIKHHFQLMLAALHSSHSNNIIKYRCNHIWFFY